MEPKLARIHDLIADGFVLTDIDSDHGAIVAALRRGRTRITVRLDRHDAVKLLYDEWAGVVHGIAR